MPKALQNNSLNPIDPPEAVDAPKENHNPYPASTNPTNCREDIELVQGQGLDVDDDNEPAPENVPERNTPLLGK
eukprot:scaffold5837_cov76-Cyclotella_meneghiniana.AAC.4